MPSSLESIEAAIQLASTPGFRGQLLARGQARAMIWRNGELPEGAPEFSPQLSYDLQSYGYSMLEQGLRLRELGGDATTAQTAFEQAAKALEAVYAKSDAIQNDRHFHLVVVAAAYHMAHLSAQAFSILSAIPGEPNYSPIERALAHLMLRDIGALERQILPSLLDGVGSDSAILSSLEGYWAANADSRGGERSQEDSILVENLDRALIDNFFRALASFLLALETGEESLAGEAVALIKNGLSVSADLNLVPQWWSHKIAVHLIDDLWDSSYHERLPKNPEGSQAPEWGRLRESFIALLLRRGKAEIEVWPSQLDAASRAVNQADDLVVSLPTSAGKTRIAELCILRCFAERKRVAFVTPLRALSAQTEMAMQRTFVPLGKTVSALYGCIGVSGFDEDAIRQRDIVVATPEKLDFALRNDPSLLDDVGLVIFDEGHMIGLSEREVRYEVQIQRLLRRPDATGRRIVCLSAILPDGDQLDDFAAWLRRDQPGNLVKSDWRPTRLRYGEVVWNGRSARLNLRVGDERPFIQRFLEGEVPPIGKRKKLFPCDLGELCLATAWRLVADGHSVLVYCPVRAHVEPFADRIIDLHKRGSLKSLLCVDEEKLSSALILGQEWFGANHPILKCLLLGIAIHHGALPTAYRKEVERLLREGILKVTISSPTLAQGLNLSATVVVIHSLYRNKERIEASEFKNVVGRAGRAFVDVEGLVLYPIFDKHTYRQRQWEELIDDARSREMESGLVRLVATLLVRMNGFLGNPPMPQLLEYVLNNGEAWAFPELLTEDADNRERERGRWRTYLTSLDTAILSLLGEHDIADDEVAAKLDDVLRSSLWERRILRRSEEMREVFNAALFSRARYIWERSNSTQRKGYFLAGVGLDTGHALDEIAGEANALLVEVNAAIARGDNEVATQAFERIAEIVFAIDTFMPDSLPDNWRAVLRAWLSGVPLANVAAGYEAEVLHFVESGLVYRLPWAMEALRVRAIANGDQVGDFGIKIEDLELDLAIPALETGTLNRSAAVLMQAGLTSRMGAIKAVEHSHAVFTNVGELGKWLQSSVVEALSKENDWPTPETAQLWKMFASNFEPTSDSVWEDQSYWAQATWHEHVVPQPKQPIRVVAEHSSGQPYLLSAGGEHLGWVNASINPNRKGLLRAHVMDVTSRISLTYIGPKDLFV